MGKCKLKITICFAIGFAIFNLYGSVFNIKLLVQLVLNVGDKRNIGLGVGCQMHGKGCIGGA